VRFWLSLLVVAGCYNPNPSSGVPCSEDGHCPGSQVCDQQQSPPTCVDALGDAANPAPDGGVDAPPDAPPVACTTNAECPASQPVCDLGAQSCRGCFADGECASDVCHELAGTCVDEAEALYVAPTGAGTLCTRLGPCASISNALNRVSATKTAIRIADGTYTENLDIKANGASRVLLSGTDRAWGGAVITAGGIGSRVDTLTTAVLEGLTLFNAGQDGLDNRGTATLSRVRVAQSGNTGIVSRNAAVLRVVDSLIETSTEGGISVDGGMLSVERCVIVSNENGGIRIGSAGFTIVSSIIANNGTPAGSPNGGVRIVGPSSSTGVFQFNTIARNRSDAGAASGVQCDRTVTIESSIVASNTALLGQELSAMCAPVRSLFLTAAPAGMGNLTGNPMFVSTTDFHVLPGSAAIDATPTAPPSRDVDGEPRPSGARADIGADEVP
jgi:hypothetical protein